VYEPDGKTPASGVIIYIYHTDQRGVYATKGNETGWGKRHGYIRGWMKTNEKGEYKFFTLKPASYPNREVPAHIHITIKEPDKNEYYIDEYLFDDDTLLTSDERNKQPGRGGNGILKTVEVEKGFLKAVRDIYLGKNIPNYPGK
jgi:protocatechuate 3,4-dioxygenase beta subunit